MTLNIILLVAAYFFMEFVAWSNHKYVMHGLLWIWHKDHHINDTKKVALGEVSTRSFEKNDYFFALYALPAIALFLLGLSLGQFSFVFVAAGITLYGLTYFLVHDVLIHQRLAVPLMKRPGNRYARAIISAHLAHHRPRNKDDFRNYGLLVFPLRFFKD